MSHESISPLGFHKFIPMYFQIFNIVLEILFRDCHKLSRCLLLYLIHSVSKVILEENTRTSKEANQDRSGGNADRPRSRDNFSNKT